MKKIVSYTLCTVIALSVAILFYVCESKKEEFAKLEQAKVPAQKDNISTPKVSTEKNCAPIYDLYSDATFDLPLFSILEISKLPLSTKKVVDELLEISQGFYILKQVNDKVLIVLQNPIDVQNTYNRHELQFAEIFPDGKIIYHTAGYKGIDGEITLEITSEDDVWEFDKNSEINRPTKHVAFDEKGKIKFAEFWNYSEDKPVKYEMRDAHKKTVSILKEFQDNDSSLRREHVFYDNNGKIKMSFTVNYDGANVSRVMLFNSHDKIDSLSIISEYQDGKKVKESIYNENFELINTVEAEYENDVRTAIKLYNSNGEEIYKITR